jgi:DNA-binding NarL/FixJ family response regulator
LPSWLSPAPFHDVGAPERLAHVELDSHPRVLLGNLEPIVLIGMSRVLGEAGADVIGHEQHPAQLVTQAGRLRPDVVVIGRDGEPSRRLGHRVREASTDTKVILWARDETVMEVLDPDAADFRVVEEALPEQLRSEMGGGSRREQRVEE